MRKILRQCWFRPWFRYSIIAGVIIALCFAVKIWHDTMRDPVVERLVVEAKGMARDEPPVTIAFLSDIHVAGPDMPPSRLERIVAQVNALDADVIVIAGDLVSEKRTATKIYTAPEIIAPLGGLEAPLGVVVVPGNHDHWYDWHALKSELAKHSHITVLENSAAQIGPLAVAGLDDEHTGRHNLEATSAAMLPLQGAQIWLSHSPDTFPSIPVSADLVLAGHTHCGQIAYPWGGAPATMSDYGKKYACGVVREHGKTLVTSAGLGTSLLPVRLFTQPEVWLIELRSAGEAN